MSIHAYIVSVDYSDLLNITLPYNRNHFENVTVVTTKADTHTRAVAIKNECTVFKTDRFYDQAACFNKYAALQQCISESITDCRSDIVCVMDADVMFPKVIDWSFLDNPANADCLFTPERHMCRDIPDCMPQEPYWKSYEKNKEQEWAGYTQIFNINDSHLPETEKWFSTNWTHAGGADSEFQARWPKSHKKRPTFSVLHLGREGVNWCGRVTPTLDGEVFHQAEHRIANMKFMRDKRKTTGNYDHEKL